MLQRHKPGSPNEIKGESTGHTLIAVSSLWQVTPLLTANKWRLVPGIISFAGSMGAPKRPAENCGLLTLNGSKASRLRGVFQAFCFPHSIARLYKVRDAEK